MNAKLLGYNLRSRRAWRDYPRFYVTRADAVHNHVLIVDSKGWVPSGILSRYYVMED